jgi:hypothetical protein
MITHELRMKVVKHIMYELRADGPIGVRTLRAAVLDQVPGITRENLDEAWAWAWTFVNHARWPMVAEYEMFGDRPPVEQRTYVVHDRMHDRDEVERECVEFLRERFGDDLADRYASRCRGEISRDEGYE